MLQAPLVQQGADGDHGGEEGSDHEDHGQIGDGLMSAEEKGVRPPRITASAAEQRTQVRSREVRRGWTSI